MSEETKAVIIDGETPEERLQYAQSVFGLVKQKKVRVETAMRRRKVLAGFLARNEEPTGPASNRLEYIRGTAEKVVELLANTAQTFNTTYSDDLATVADLMDILATAQAMLRARTA